MKCVVRPADYQTRQRSKTPWQVASPPTIPSAHDHTCSTRHSQFIIFHRRYPRFGTQSLWKYPRYGPQLSLIRLTGTTPPFLGRLYFHFLEAKRKSSVDNSSARPLRQSPFATRLGATRHACAKVERLRLPVRPRVKPASGWCEG